MYVTQGNFSCRAKLVLNFEFHSSSGSSLPYYLPILGRRTGRFICFQIILMRSETQTAMVQDLNLDPPFQFPTTITVTLSAVELSYMSPNAEIDTRYHLLSNAQNMLPLQN